MGGKSSYIKQVALITILAQVLQYLVHMYPIKLKKVGGVKKSNLQ